MNKSKELKILRTTKRRQLLSRLFVNFRNGKRRRPKRKRTKGKPRPAKIRLLEKTKIDARRSTKSQKERVLLLRVSANDIQY